MPFCLPRRIWHTATLFAAALALAPPAGAQVVYHRTFSEMIQKSDQIFVGQCVQKEFLVRNSTIITKYTFKPSELLKGTLAPGTGGDVVVEEAGGEFPGGKLPIAVGVPGASHIQQGEEVLLMTEKQKLPPQLKALRAQQLAAKKAKGLAATPTFDDSASLILGMNQGYFTVITNPENGQKMVAHGGGFAMARAKMALANVSTTGTAKALRNSMLKQMKSTSAEQMREKLKGEPFPNEIKSFAALDDVKTEIALALQKSK